MYKLKGYYNSGTSYNVGDVVLYDNQAFHLRVPARAGTHPVNTAYWSELGGDLTEAAYLANAAGVTATDKSVAKSSIVDNLTTDSASKVLSAKQGKALNERLTAVEPLANPATTNKTMYLASSTEASTKVFAITVDDDGTLTATEVGA